MSLVPKVFAISPELQSVLKNVTPDEEIPVIIILRDKADFSIPRNVIKSLRRLQLIKNLKSNAEVSQRSVRAFLEDGGAKKIKPLWIINGIAVTTRAEVIGELITLPGIEDIRLDAVVHAPRVISGTPAIPEWNLETVHAPDLWALGYRGAGVVVASMDTGVDVNHPDLTEKWRGGSNSWYDPHGEHITPYDSAGHGTQTMGIIAGGDAGGTAIGVAPEAKWIAVKIFNDAGQTSLSTIHQGFQWLLDPDNNPDTDDAPDIVNNSWGLSNINYCSLEFQSDIQALKAADIAVVFAAGNSGPSSSTSVSPANNPESFAVGAIDASLTISLSSSRGPSACDGDIYPEVVAPGVNIKTSDLTFNGLFPDSYAVVSGTSLSSAHVTGAMALLLSAFSDVTVSELESALKQSAMDLGTPDSDNEYGYGLIDIMTAYNLLFNPVPDIGVFPSSHDFGTTLIGKISSSKSFTITNKGSADLILGTISMVGSYPLDFKILNDGCSEKTVNPSSLCTIEAAFSPSSEGVKNAALSIPSNDPDENPFTIKLTGTALKEFIPPPSSLRVVVALRKSILLSWRYNARNGKGFFIERSEDGGITWTRVGKIGKYVKRFWDGGLTRKTIYWYRVQAFNTEGVSEYSNTVSAATR